MEDTVLKLFKKLDVELDPSDIEDCHCLPSKGQKSHREVFQTKRRKQHSKG